MRARKPDGPIRSRFARRLRWILLCALLASSLSPDLARAAPARRTIKQRVRALVIKGHKAFRWRRYKRALRHYRAAYRLWPTKEIEFNLALVYLELKQPIAAATHLRRYLKQAGSTAKKKLPGVFRRLLKRVAFLTVEVVDPEATIWIGGTSVGKRRAEVALLPGRHRVEVRVGNRILRSRTVNLVAGQALLWQPDLEGGPTDRPDKPRPRARKKLHWAYFVTLSSVAVIAGGTLIYTGVRTRQLKADYNDAPSLDLRREGTRYMNATNALIAVAGSAAVAALVVGLFTRWRPREGTKGLVILPSVSPGGAGLWLRWQP